ncbi:MAG: hypothetical protein MUO21_11940 [Nitrososphaeraceae archaeon]|nr:hypothetical protein [Nitrososphaeraceae archaeon]
MNQTCTPNIYVVELIINTIVHIAILFLILGLFFRFYVAGVIKSSLENELDHLIHENIGNKLNENLSESQKATLKQVASSGALDRINKYYDKPDKTVKTHNDCLFRDMFTITSLLFVFATTIIIVSYLLCDKVNVKHMLLENTIIFAGVGLVEFLFFKMVATKYIPAPPSLMATSIMDNLKKSLSV